MTDQYINSDAIKFYIGEVHSYGDNLYQGNREPDIPIYKSPKKRFALNIAIRENSNVRLIEQVIPASNNIKQIPIIGENVLIFQGFSQASKAKGDIKTQRQWFYLMPLNLRFNTTENLMLTYQESTTLKQLPDKEFDKVSKKKIVSPLQPYRGDLLIEGRFGNTIRLGSTNVKTDEYKIPVPWKGKNPSDPIIILSNHQFQKPGKEENLDKFYVESFKKEDSSIYLTSKQTFPELKLGGVKKNPLKKYKSESTFDKSQFISVADRIILSAKTDIIVLDSPKSIVLNTGDMIKLGNDTANVSMVHGDVLYKILQRILDQLQAPIKCGSSLGTFIKKDKLAEAQKEMKNLLSSKYFMKKNTY